MNKQKELDKLISGDYSVSDLDEFGYLDEEDLDILFNKKRGKHVGKDTSCSCMGRVCSCEGEGIED